MSQPDEFTGTVAGEEKGFLLPPSWWTGKLDKEGHFLDANGERSVAPWARLSEEELTPEAVVGFDPYSVFR